MKYWANGAPLLQPDPNGDGGMKYWASGAPLPLPTGSSPVTTFLEIGPASVSHYENSGSPTTFTYIVTRSGDVSGETTIDWEVQPASTDPADEYDFVGAVFPSGSLTFLAGETQKTIEIDVEDDDDLEPDENFIVALSNVVGGAIINGSASGVIYNDDAPPAVRRRNAMTIVC